MTAIQNIFAGEAADVFSYLMGIANEYKIRIAQEEDRTFSFEDEFIQRYPGLCTQCGFRVCICPSIPKATVGRMAKELDIGSKEDLFQSPTDEFSRNGHDIAASVIDKVGGYSNLVKRYPFDRGDANRALITLCLQLANALDKNKPKLAEHFRSAAIQLSSIIKEPGSPAEDNATTEVFNLEPFLREAWRELNTDQKAEITNGGSSSLVKDIGKLIGKVRVLFIQCSPTDQESLRLSSELRAIREAIRLAGRKEDILIESLPAATTDDLRRALLQNEYEIIHFSGHADQNVLIFESEDGLSVNAPLATLSQIIGDYKNIQCVILNACKSATNLNTPIAPYTIGMDADIDDDVAIEFARGFYDAIAANKGIELAIKEGRNAAELKGKGSPPIQVLKNNTP